jgi:hypothetical protein
MCQNDFDDNVLDTVPHSSYSRDLAPSDFWPFWHVKTSLASRVFNDLHKLLEMVIEFLSEIQLSELPVVLHHWTERMKYVLAHNGDSHYE